MCTEYSQKEIMLYSLYFVLTTVYKIVQQNKMDYFKNKSLKIKMLLVLGNTYNVGEAQLVG